MNTSGPLRLEAMYVIFCTVLLLNFLIIYYYYDIILFLSQAGSIHVRVRRDANEQVNE